MLLCKKHPGLEGLRYQPYGRNRFGQCVACIKESQAKYREAHKELVNTRITAWQKAHPEKIRAWGAAWRKNNPEKWRASNAAYRKANPEKQRVSNAATSRRRDAAKLNATPAWANKFFIDEAYSLTKLREKICGGKWHVDHIVPLKSDLVCGLHVEHNLRVILGLENIRKNNRHWPDMPGPA